MSDPGALDVHVFVDGRYVAAARRVGAGDRDARRLIGWLLPRVEAWADRAFVIETEDAATGDRLIARGCRPDQLESIGSCLDGMLADDEPGRWRVRFQGWSAPRL